MFKSEHPEYIALCLLIVLIWAIWWLSGWLRRRRAERIGHLDSMDRISYSVMPRADLWKTILLSVAVLLGIIALVNPQWGRKKEKVKVSSTDVIIAIDISSSMLADDVKPSRLERTKLFADRMIDRLKGERIGLVLFAHDAYVQVPMTTDYAALKLFLTSADPQLAATQGTNLAEAIKTCVNTFPKTDKRPGSIILITDGENHEEGDLEAARTAKAEGYKVYVVGVGTEQGARIPEVFQGRNMYKRDETGELVMTRLSKETVVALADAGGGKSFLIGEGQRVYDVIESDIENMEKTESEQLSFAEYVSYYQYFLGICILLLMLSYLLPFGKIYRPLKS